MYPKEGGGGGYTREVKLIGRETRDLRIKCFAFRNYKSFMGLTDTE